MMLSNCIELTMLEMPFELSCVCESCVIPMCVIVSMERTSETSITDTVNIVSQSHSILYPPSDSNSEAQASTRRDVSLETLHDVLVQINLRLLAIEINNSSLNNRFYDIENRMAHFQTVTTTVSCLGEKDQDF
jgi:hypothetical protein